MSAPLRLTLTLSGVGLVALWPAAAWRWLGIPLVVLIVWSVTAGLRWSTLFRRLGIVWLLSGLMGVGLIGQEQWLLRAGNLLMKSSLSVWAVSLLTHGTPIPDLIGALRRLGLSRIWTDSLAFWSRYYSVLTEEWERMQLARRARTMTRDRRRKFRALAGGLGLLFVRAYERAEQVHRAMLARGYRVMPEQNPAGATSAGARPRQSRPEPVLPPR